MSPTDIRLFVYGTLKRGCDNHDRYCAAASAVVEAAVWGRLYGLEAGYPALEMPRELILARGSADPAADARTQHGAVGLTWTRPAGDWDLVHGEAVTFADARRGLPPIDELEDFRPDGSGLYDRVLVPARCGDVAVAVWTYVMAPPAGAQRISGGRWNAAA